MQQVTFHYFHPPPRSASFTAGDGGSYGSRYDIRIINHFVGHRNYHNMIYLSTTHDVIVLGNQEFVFTMAGLVESNYLVIWFQFSGQSLLNTPILNAFELKSLFLLKSHYFLSKNNDFSHRSF